MVARVSHHPFFERKSLFSQCTHTDKIKIKLNFQLQKKNYIALCGNQQYPMAESIENSCGYQVNLFPVKSFFVRAITLRQCKIQTKKQTINTKTKKQKQL